MTITKADFESESVDEHHVPTSSTGSPSATNQQEENKAQLKICDEVRKH